MKGKRKKEKEKRNKKNKRLLSKEKYWKKKTKK